MLAGDDLHSPLRRYWGYDSFRPLQERIVNSIVSGRDVAVVMPTGGGKSLCYQLPALITGGTAIVVSPLIALMQDQAAQLEQMGIPAAALTSMLPAAEQSRVMREATRGAFRLLYLSPERLARDDTAAWLGRVPVSFFAIDEAHCISEWGHEFRPEYRQLSRLRERFPERAIAAFTASATRRVRHDIIDQLKLRDPDKYIASFNRPNLRYILRKCDSDEQSRLLLAALRHHAGRNVIIYAPTVARVEETVDWLGERKIRAVPYHGQMEGAVRQRNQERWMTDEVPVLVGTLAFGLGINKPQVRAVIHLAMPKSIEQYYQEAGRAGRDGETADCALLWQGKDIGLLAYFIDQLRDPEERERSWQRYHTMRRFAEGSQCRHRQICLHFGETPKWETCGMCDVCAEPPAWLNKSNSAQAVAKIRPRAKPSRNESDAPEAATDPALFDFLREWRRKMARETGIAAFMVMSDATMQDLAVKRPSSIEGLMAVSGIGVKKAELYGKEILETLQAFRDGARATSVKSEAANSPADETMKLLADGKSLDEIAAIRGRKLETVVGMVASLIESGKLEFRPDWVRAEFLPRIEAAVAQLGAQWLRPLKQALPAEVTFEEIRLIVARMRAKKRQ